MFLYIVKTPSIMVESNTLINDMTTFQMLHIRRGDPQAYSTSQIIANMLTKAIARD